MVEVLPPNVSGIRFTDTQKKMQLMPVRVPKRMKLATPQSPIGRKGNVSKKSGFIQDVDLLMTDYNDKAFLYNNGKVDIIKGDNLKTVTFPTKKAAALYLMKAGWKYV